MNIHFFFSILILQNNPTPSSDESLLIPQHNYKLDAHALNSRHPGEVWQHTSSIFECLEVAAADTLFALCLVFKKIYP